MADTDAPSADDLMAQTKDLHQTLSGLTANAPSPDDLLTATRAVVPAQPAEKPAQPSALPGPGVPSPDEQSAELGLPLPRSPPPGGLVDTSLTPGPNVGNVLPLSQDAAGNMRFALPNPVRALLTEGPQVQDGKLTVPAATIDPGTGTLGLTPEYTAGASMFMGSPRRFSGANALMRDPASAFTLTGPPSVTMDELRAAIGRADQKPAEAAPPSGAAGPQPDGATAPAQPQFLDGKWLRNAGATGQGFDMGKGGAALTGQVSDALARGDTVQLVTDGGNKTVGITGLNRQGMMVDAKGQPWGSASVAFDGTGREGLRITPSAGPQPGSAPTTPPPGATPPGPAPAAGPPPTTAAEALPIATGLLEQARASGANLTPDYTNQFIDKATADATPAGPGTAAVAGPNDPVAAMVQRLQVLRDQPLSITDVMGMDRTLNAQRRTAYKAGNDDLGNRIGNLQDSLRDQVDAATEADVGGGADGWNAFKDGRAGYSQYKKMQAVEDMKERADGTQNPTSSYKTAVNNFVNSPKARGWSDDEIASVKDSADRGFVGGTLHMLGSRFIPYIAGGAGLAHSPMTAIATMVGAHYMGDMVRNVGNVLQAQRVGRTVTGLGSSIPNPRNQLTAPPPPNQLITPGAP